MVVKLHYQERHIFIYYYQDLMHYYEFSLLICKGIMREGYKDMKKVSCKCILLQY